MGFGYGPLVVAKESRSLASLAGVRVAIPGPMTTAALLLRIECPDAIPVEHRFDAIPDAIVNGEFEAGVIIHESQLTYGEQGLVKIVDFGELWEKRDGLPLPLGLDVVRRDLGPDLMREISRGFRASIQSAIDDEDAALTYALQFGRGVDHGTGRKFVRMYVNELTLDMGARGRQALEKLYERAVASGVLAAGPRLEVV
jgi:1,4-dihydroxy-6-naphthoate synthase